MTTARYPRKHNKTSKPRRVAAERHARREGHKALRPVRGLLVATPKSIDEIEEVLL